MTVSLGILSWKAHETLRKTLASYAPLAPLVDERAVYFNAITDEDRALAAEFGFAARGTAENLGIFGGTRALLRSLSGELVLCCQNDNPLCADAATAASRLAAARVALESGAVRWVRMRDRFDPGFSDAAKYLRFWGPGVAPALRRVLRPFKADRMRGRAVSALERPDERFPDVFRRGDDGLFYGSSRRIDYSDQPFLATRAFMLEAFDWAERNKRGMRTLNGRFVPEIILNSSGWWRRGDFPVAVSDGIFAHARLDDSFRADNAAFNSSIVG